MGSSPTGSIIIIVQEQHLLTGHLQDLLDLVTLTLKQTQLAVTRFCAATKVLTNDARQPDLVLLYECKTKCHVCMSTCGLVAMTSASHAEGRQFDPGQVYCASRCPQRAH